MYHKLKKASGLLKVGSYIDVHEDQKSDLVERGIIEADGVEINPSAPKEEETGEPGITSTSSIIDNKKVKK